MILDADFVAVDFSMPSDFGIVTVVGGETAEEAFLRGRMAEHDAFWDEYQQQGTRTDYKYAFSIGWTDTNFRPKYDVTLAGSNERCFGSNKITNLAERFEECGVKLDTSMATNLAYGFFSGVNTRCPEISLIGLTNQSDGIFGWNTSLVTIDKIILKEDGTTPIAANWFTGLSSLENLVVEGTIGKNNFSVANSPKLTHDSLVSIVNALQDKNGDTSGVVWTVTIGAANKAKLTAEELQIAQDKGWTVK